MEKVAILNLKGGIGKTTTAVSLAAILATEHKKKVLLVDCDMQGNASKALGQYSPDGKGTHSIMQGEQLPEECVVKATCLPEGTLDIIPANMYLMQANAQVLQDTEGEQLHILDRALERLEELERTWRMTAYDVVIFDCALGLDMTVLNAVIASDLIIAPVPFGGYEIDGLQQLQEQVEDLKSIKPDLQMKALFTMKQGNKTNKEFEEWLHDGSGYNVFEAAITRSVTVQKAALEGLPLPIFSKNGAATKDYRRVAEELVNDLEEIRNRKAQRGAND